MAMSNTNTGESAGGGRTWAVVIVGLVVMVTVVYLGWASSYLSARLITGARTPVVKQSAPATAETSSER
ncbi:hypothetical protein CL628_02485 [bacterium]|nr:hypothetical protein [bacterium]